MIKAKKINERLEKHKYNLLLFFLVFSFISNGQNKPNDEVIKWTEGYLLKNNHFNFLEDSLKSPTFSKDLMPWYHILSVETQNFDTVKVSIYQMGINSSSRHDMFLIYKRYKNKDSQFQIIGADINLRESLDMFVFFKQFKKFSAKTRLICYEKIIRDRYYFDILFPKEE